MILSFNKIRSNFSDGFTVVYARMFGRFTDKKIGKPVVGLAFVDMMHNVIWRQVEIVAKLREIFGFVVKPFEVFFNYKTMQKYKTIIVKWVRWYTDLFISLPVGSYATHFINENTNGIGFTFLGAESRAFPCTPIRNSNRHATSLTQERAESGLRIIANSLLSLITNGYVLVKAILGTVLLDVAKAVLYLNFLFAKKANQGYEVWHNGKMVGYLIISILTLRLE